MSILSASVAPVNSNGAALAALDRFLGEFNYTSRCRSDARRIVLRTGCVADCVPTCLDREHLEAAEEEYVAALPAVDLNDDTWGDPGIYIDIESLLAVGRSFPGATVDLGAIDKALERVGSRGTLAPPELDDDFGDNIPFLGDRLIWEAS
jgi:hypothetical protein